MSGGGRAGGVQCQAGRSQGARGVEVLVRLVHKRAVVVEHTRVVCGRRELPGAVQRVVVLGSKVALHPGVPARRAAVELLPRRRGDTDTVNHHGREPALDSRSTEKKDKDKDKGTVKGKEKGGDEDESNRPAPSWRCP